MKRILLPKSLQTFLKCALAVAVFACCLFIGWTLASCTSRTVAQVSMNNKLESENDLFRRQIYAYNSLLHRIWIDKPNYVEDVLCETDEWIVLDKAVDGDFQHAFEFESKEDSVAYHLNWYNGDSTVRVVKLVVNDVNELEHGD
jgi:hypothetical protein